MIRCAPSRNISLPTSSEHSHLASPREPQSPLRQWQKANLSNLQGQSDKQAIALLAREIQKLRRRILGGNGISGQTVYVKACLEDGTECYVPIQVSDTIYRTRADVPGTAPTINEGKVPDGTTELI